MATYSLPLNNDNSYLFFGRIAVDGRLGLPNSIREGMLSAGKGKSALVLDALLACGWSGGKIFTFKQVLRVLDQFGIALSPALLREALGAGVLRTGKTKPTRGRPEIVYHMPEISRLAGDYANGFISVTDVLEVGDLQSLKAYRIGMHRAFIQRRAGIYSRKFLSQRLGIGKRTTRNYDKAAGVKVVKRVVEQSFFTYISNWEDLITGATAGKQWLRIYFPDGKVLNAPLRVGIVQRWAWVPNVTVKLVTQLANSYSLHEELAAA